MPAKRRKDVIFFSHSTRDADYLKRLKELFVERTNGTIDVFLSCDGESIRYGSNWSWKIEAKAKQCRLMFAFLSPHSIASKWLYFETGFALARGKDVVPIGILGTNPGDVGPPLSQLQGFRVHSTDTLNNILVVINQHFGSNYRPSFTDSDYASLEAVSASTVSGPFGDFTQYIENVEIEISHPLFQTQDKSQLASAMSKLTSGFTSLNIPFECHDIVVNCLGMRGFVIDPSTGTFKFRASPASLATTYPQMKDVIRLFDEPIVKTLMFRVSLESSFRVTERPEELSGRLMNSGVSLAKFGWLSLANVEFHARNVNQFPPHPSPIGCEIVIRSKEKAELELVDAANLIHQFWERGLIYMQT